jgi:hypothetical protein
MSHWILATALATVVFALASASTGAIASPTAVQSRTIYFWVFPAALQQPQMRPPRVTFAADGNHYVTQLRWRGWGNNTTRATGIDHIDNCVPNCVSGHIFAVPAKVTLSRPGKQMRREVYRCFNVFAPSGPAGQRNFRGC